MEGQAVHCAIVSGVIPFSTLSLHNSTAVYTTEGAPPLGPGGGQASKNPVAWIAVACLYSCLQLWVAAFYPQGPSYSDTHTICPSVMADCCRVPDAVTNKTLGAMQVALEIWHCMAIVRLSGISDMLWETDCRLRGWRGVGSCKCCKQSPWSWLPGGLEICSGEGCLEEEGRGSQELCHHCHQIPHCFLCSLGLFPGEIFLHNPYFPSVLIWACLFLSGRGYKWVSMNPLRWDKAHLSPWGGSEIALQLPGV